MSKSEQSSIAISQTAHPFFEAPPTSVDALFRMAMDHAANDLEGARALALSWLDNDPDLMRALANPLIKVAVYDGVRHIAHQRRVRIISVADGRSQGVISEDRLRRAQETVFDSWLLPGGLKLGDACRPDLLAAAEVHREHARSNEAMARIYDRFAAVVNDLPVRQAISAEKAIELMKEQV